VVAVVRYEFKDGEICEIFEAPCEIANPGTCRVRQAEIEKRAANGAENEAEADEIQVRAGGCPSCPKASSLLSPRAAKKEDEKVRKSL